MAAYHCSGKRSQILVCSLSVFSRQVASDSCLGTLSDLVHGLSDPHASLGLEETVWSGVLLFLEW